MPPSGPPPAKARPMRRRRALTFPPPLRRGGAAAPDIDHSPLGFCRANRHAVPPDSTRYYDFLPARFTLRTDRAARTLAARCFACLRGFGAAAVTVNAGILTLGRPEEAVSARRLAVASAVARATRQSEVAVATDDSTRPPII